MTRVRATLGCLAVLALCLDAGCTARSTPPPSADARVSRWTLPPAFEPNAGQAPPWMDFIARTSDGPLGLGPDALSLGSGRVRFLGARQVHGEGRSPLPGRVSYFLGADPARWRSGLPTYARVEYRDVYPETTLAYHWSDHHLEFDLELAPGADPGLVRMAFEGSEALFVDERGDLHFRIGGKDWTARRPDVRPLGRARYVLSTDGVVTLSVSGGDATHPLLVDPVLAVSSSFGAGNTLYVTALGLDASGDAYACGFTPTSVPTTRGAFAPASSGGQEGFVAKLGPGGVSLAYATYLGGSGDDACRALAVGDAGVTVVGDTDSVDFPTTPGAPQRAKSGGRDAFIARLDPSGASLLFGTYLGGDADDSARAVALDPSGTAYVAGVTASTDLPTVDGGFQTKSSGGNDAFVFAVSADAGPWLFGTYLGGSNDDAAAAIAVDSSADVFVAGSTSSTDFPVTVGAFQPAHAAGFGTGFVAKVGPGGQTLTYATYLGGSQSTEAAGVAVTASGQAVVVGQTRATDFPVTAGAAQGSQPGISAGFFATLNAAGTALTSGTYLGGSADNAATAVALDAVGDAYVTGWTDAIDFPVTAGAAFGGTIGGRDAFVLKLPLDAGPFAYATYLGGELDDLGAAIVVDDAGQAFVAGDTNSTQFPTTAGTWQPYSIGGQAAFVAQLDPAGATLRYATYLAGANVSTAQGLAVDSAGSPYVVGATYALDFPTTPGAFQTTYVGGLGDAVAAKLTPDGTALEYCTYLGGTQTDSASAAVVGPDGTLYVAGLTSSPDFPVTAGSAQATYGGAQDGFVVALAADGGSLVYGTYVGGSSEDDVTALALDGQGALLVAGASYSSDLPTTANAFQTANAGASDAFLGKLSAAGTAWLYLTYLGGSHSDSAQTVAWLPSGEALVGGLTQSPNFPVTAGAVQPGYGGAGDGFVAQLNGTGAALVWATYLGGSSDDGVYSLTLGPGGDVLAAGATASPDFPVSADAYQTSLHGLHDAFVASLAGDGGRLHYSTYLGGTQDDVAHGVAVGPAGLVLVAGSTVSPDFPTTPGALQPGLLGSQAGFVAALGQQGTQLAYGTYLGGSGLDSLNALALGPDGGLFVSGQTSSTDFPSSPGAFTTPQTGIDRNVFVASLTGFSALPDGGGPFDAGGPDAGGLADGGSPPPPTRGCGCDLGGGAPLLAFLALIVLGLRRGASKMKAGA